MIHFVQTRLFHVLKRIGTDGERERKRAANMRFAADDHIRSQRGAREIKKKGTIS
jgi:hypothetical protein